MQKMKFDFSKLGMFIKIAYKRPAIIDFINNLSPSNFFKIKTIMKMDKAFITSLI